MIEIVAAAAASAAAVISGLNLFILASFERRLERLESKFMEGLQ